VSQINVAQITTFLFDIAGTSRVVCTHLEIMADSLDWYLNTTLNTCAAYA